MTLDLSCPLPVVSALVASSVEICIRWSKVMVAVTTNITLRPRQNGRHFPDDIYKSIFLNENVWFSIKISLKFISKDPINNMPALVQIMAWRRPGDKPLSEPMLVSLLTHICVTRPQWDMTGPVVSYPTIINKDYSQCYYFIQSAILWSHLDRLNHIKMNYSITA